MPGWERDTGGGVPSVFCALVRETAAVQTTARANNFVRDSEEKCIGIDTESMKGGRLRENAGRIKVGGNCQTTACGAMRLPEFQAEIILLRSDRVDDP